MSRLRALAESDLEQTLEGEWSCPVRLTTPDGVRLTETIDGRPLCGQVLYDIVRKDLETGERVVFTTPVVTLRRASLLRVPTAGENWLVEIPVNPLTDSPLVPYVFSPTRPPEGGRSLGFIRLYLQAVEQEDDE